jgi:hypothetical protein
VKRQIKTLLLYLSFLHALMKFKDIDKIKGERKYQYLKYKNKNHSGTDTYKLSDINLAPNLNLSFVQNTIEDLI